MNKREAIKRVEQMGEYESFVDEPISKKSVLNIISQIHEPKKVIVPKYVADWIEWCKKNKITLLGADTAICNNKNIRTLDACGWAMKNQETFAKAWLYDYEIEKEKLYTVEIPNPNKIGNDVNALMMNGFKQIVIVKEYGDNWKKEKGFQLTEAEIKQDFEWAWSAGFAKEVEE